MIILFYIFNRARRRADEAHLSTPPGCPQGLPWQDCTAYTTLSDWQTRQADANMATMLNHAITCREETVADALTTLHVPWQVEHQHAFR